MAYYLPGRTMPALKNKEEDDLNDSMDEIVWDINSRINNFFRHQCCPTNKHFIEVAFKDKNNQTFYLFINDEKTHYILCKKPIVLNNVIVKPLITYSDNIVSIIHENIVYFFKVYFAKRLSQMITLFRKTCGTDIKYFFKIING